MHELVREGARKVVHLASLSIPVVYITYGRESTLAFLVYCLVGFLVAEFVRIELGVRIPFFDIIAREQEAERVGAEVYFTLGALVAVAAYTKAVACAVILMASLGDMTASLVGKAVRGTRLYGDKTVAGAGGELVMDVVAVTVLGAVVPAVALPAVVVFAMAIAATVVETLVERIDDNLAVPVIAGLIGNLVLGVPLG